MLRASTLPDTASPCHLPSLLCILSLSAPSTHPQVLSSPNMNSYCRAELLMLKKPTLRAIRKKKNWGRGCFWEHREDRDESLFLITISLDFSWKVKLFKSQGTNLNACSPEPSAKHSSKHTQTGIFKSQFHQIMKTRKESTLRKASLPVRLLIIQKLEEMLSSPVATRALQSSHLLPRAVLMRWIRKSLRG